MERIDERYKKMLLLNGMMKAVLILTIVFGGIGVIGMTMVEKVAGTNAEVQAALEGVELPTSFEMAVLAVTTILCIAILVMVFQNGKRMKEKEAITILPYVLYIVISGYDIVTSLTSPEGGYADIVMSVLFAIPSIVIIYHNQKLHQMKAASVN